MTERQLCKCRTEGSKAGSFSGVRDPACKQRKGFDGRRQQIHFIGIEEESC